jgi:hypothetical protein
MIKTILALSSLKEAILELQDKIEIVFEVWKEPTKNKAGTNWNPSKSDWRK